MIILIRLMLDISGSVRLIYMASEACEKMMKFIRAQGIDLSPRTYFITALTYMAYGLFSSMIIGLIIQTIGNQVGIAFLTTIGTAAISYYGAAIGGAVSYGLKAPPLVLFASIACGAFAAEMGGGPAGAYVAALIGTEFGKLVSKTTPVDIIVTPLVVLLVGGLAGNYLGLVISEGMVWFGELINWSVAQRPFVMGILVATLMGLALTAPISSAAIAIMLGLDGLAAGAATIGCSAQMIGFAVASFRENRIGGLLAQGIGTSMLQISNIIRNPLILIPPTVAGMLLAPLGTVWWQMESVKEGAGMGTAGFVGQIFTLHTMGTHAEVWMKIFILHLIGPAVISLLISEWMRRMNWIRSGDMKLEL